MSMKTSKTREAFLSASMQDISRIKTRAGRLLSQCGSSSEQPAKERVLRLIRVAESLGLVNETAMKNSGLLEVGNKPWTAVHALQHVFHRAERAVNIMANPDGYTPPSRSLYGLNNGRPSARDIFGWRV